MAEPKFLPVHITNVAATATLTVADCGLVLIANTGTMTINLPAAADCKGRDFLFKKTSASATAVTIDPAASETIDGSTTNTQLDTQYESIRIISDGTAWHKVAQI